MSDSSASDMSDNDSSDEEQVPIAQQTWVTCAVCYAPHDKAHSGAFRVQWGATWYACNPWLDEDYDASRSCFGRLMRQETDIKPILPARLFTMRTKRNLKTDERRIFTNIADAEYEQAQHVGTSPYEQDDGFQWGIWHDTHWSAADRDYWETHGYVRGSSKALAKKARDDFENDSKLFWYDMYSDMVDQYKLGCDGCFAGDERAELVWRVPRSVQEQRIAHMRKSTQTLQAELANVALHD